MKSETGALGGSDDAAIDEAARLLDEEEKDLWRQLRRKRDFEVRLVEKRSQTEELEKKRMGPRIAQAEVMASLEVLTQEMEFVKSQQRELEHDLAVLKESNRLLQPAFQAQHVGAQPNQPRTKDALAEERAHMESLQAQQEQIEQLRKHIESLHMEKQSLQQQQEALFQKQRSAEQDQNRLMGSIQDDRNLLNEVRAERIKFLEERASLEKQIAVILTGAHEAAVEDRSRWSPQRRTVPASEKVAQGLFKLPGSSGGVRGHVPQDAPLPQSAWFASVPSLQPQDQRSHWTSFEKDAISSPSFGGQKTLQTT
eukprot:s4248_g9.t1